MDSQYPRGQTPTYQHTDESPHVEEGGFSLAFVSDMEDGERLGKTIGVDETISIFDFCKRLDALFGHVPADMKLPELLQWRSSVLHKFIKECNGKTILVVYPSAMDHRELTIAMPTASKFFSQSVWCDVRVSSAIDKQDPTRPIPSTITGHRLDLAKMDNPVVECLRVRSVFSHKFKPGDKIQL